jgi:hypothetical protein
LISSDDLNAPPLLHWRGGEGENHLVSQISEGFSSMLNPMIQQSNDPMIPPLKGLRLFRRWGGSDGESIVMGRCIGLPKFLREGGQLSVNVWLRWVIGCLIQELRKDFDGILLVIRCG